MTTQFISRLGIRVDTGKTIAFIYTKAAEYRTHQCCVAPHVPVASHGSLHKSTGLRTHCIGPTLITSPDFPGGVTLASTFFHDLKVQLFVHIGPGSQTHCWRASTESSSAQCSRGLAEAAHEKRNKDTDNLSRYDESTKQPSD
jgi:hypothetical protein